MPIMLDSSGDQNSGNLELALKSATPKEQQEYVLGRELASSKAKPSSALEQQALQFYTNLHSALVNFASHSTNAPWQGQGAPDGHVALAQLVGVNPSDLDRYKKDSTFQKQLDDKVAHLDDTKKTLASDLLQQLKHGKLGNLSAIDKVLNDNATNADPYQTQLDIEIGTQGPDLAPETMGGHR